MSSERFLNSIYLLSRNPLGKQVFRIIYYLAFSIAKYWLVKFTSAKHVYIKGSYATGEWEPIVSDLDFVLIYNSYPPKKDRETVEKLKSFIPLIKDVDIYTKAQLKLQIKYGSFKNSDFDSWRPLNVRWNTSAKRLSYPKKNILDRIDDIYFYVEWFFQNIDDSGKINSYRLACLRRNLERVAGLVEKLNPKFVSKTYLLNQSLSNVKNAQQAFNWLNHVLEQLDLDLILFSVGKATHLSEILEVQQRDYYKQNFKVITSADDMELEKNKITLSLSSFKLFYSTGCIDSYVLYTNFTKTNDEFFNCLMVARYYLKLEQGRTNHVHKNTNDFELNERRREALSKLVNIKTFNLQENFIGKSVFVTASWGKEYLRRLGETHRQLHKLFGQDLSFLHVCLDGEDTFFESLESLSSVKIDEGEEYLGLWHKESLYNLAKRFLVGAEEIVFSDIDVIINDESWWTDLKSKLETTEAVQPFSVFEDQETGKKVSSSVAALEKGEETFYAPGLIWAFNKDGFRKFGLFFDLFQDGSNDGVIFKQITKANIGVVENMTWTSREIANAMPRTDITYGYIDHTLSHISHPSPKQYDNMIEFFNIMLPEIRTHVERDHLGLWRWKKVDDGFKELFQQFMKDRGFASEEFKKLFIQRRDMLLKFKVDESTLYLNEQKNVKIYSPPEELSFFLGSEFENMGVVCESDRDQISNRVIYSLEPLEERRTYCFNFLIESSKDLTQNFVARLLNCYSDDIFFHPVPLSKGMFYLVVNFYAFKNFEDPQLALDFGGKGRLHFRIRSFVQDSLHEEGEEKWQWLAEDKSSLSTKECVGSVSLKGDFRTVWHRISIRLAGVESDSYTVVIEDIYGKPLASPRIQKNTADHIGLSFRPAFTAKEVVVKFKFDQDENVTNDIVCYSSEKSL